jgi:phospholipase/carboxylesterase
MSTKGIENFYEVGPQSGSKPKSLVLLLHGLGSNGQDLISLAPYWASLLPDTVFVSPDAPFACDMVPPGYPNSYQWFSLQSRDPQDMLSGSKAAEPLLSAFIKNQMQRFNIKEESTALVGFSQGTMMSLYVAPRYQNKLAGVLGYSGALLGGEALGEAGMHKIPVQLIHGEADNVVPVEAWHMAKSALQQNGYEVSGHTTPFLMHSIDQTGLDSGAIFLKKVLGA